MLHMVEQPGNASPLPEKIFLDRRVHTTKKPEKKVWSKNHLRLLYLLSRFAMHPSTNDNEEKWLRNLPLLVMVYEAIVYGILDYDYSPVCTNIVKGGQSRRIWMNISQDAKAAIDDLREHDLVNALKTCSEDFQPSTAFQVTPRAVELLESFSMQEKKQIDAFLSSTANKRDLVSANSGLILFDSTLLKITFDVEDGKFRFVRNDGLVFISKVTDVEEVSYVSSPYLPNCLLHNEDAVFSSNANQAAKCKQGLNAIKDTLSFATVLSDVRVMVGEWIPFGPNQIVSLNDRLGSLERCQGGLFTSELDEAPTRTCLNISPGLTKIAIIDFEFDSFTNFEADIHAPHDEGIVQIESFGMHLNGNGTIIYGMSIDAIMDKSADFICVDHLSRLLVDVDLDSSKIINDLLSPHQRSLMDMLFMNDARSRNKFSLITARGITPKLPVCEYLDRGEKENELKQVLGEIHSAYDLTEDDKILIGRDGMLLLGPNADKHEPLIVTHLALLARELFIRFFFKRTFILDDKLNHARIYMQSFEKNPEALGAMRENINQCSHDLILLEEILALLRDSMRALKLPKCPSDRCGKLLYEQLEIKKTHTDLEIRCKDLGKLLRGFRAKLKQVQSQNGNMAKTILETIVHGAERNVGVLAENIRANEQHRTGSFDVLLLLFCGFISFEVVDRFTDGKLLGIDGKAIPAMQWAKDLLVDHFISYPGLWFFVDLAWMVIVAFAVHFVVILITQHVSRTQRWSFPVNRRMNISAFESFLLTKTIESRTSNFTKNTKITNIVWLEETRRKWFVSWQQLRQWNFGPPTRTQATLDFINCILLEVTFHSTIGADSQTLYEQLLEQLQKYGCFDEHYTPQYVDKRPTKHPTFRKDIFLRMITRRNVPIYPTQET